MREWSLDDREKRKRAAPAEVSIRQCRECFFVYRPAAKCPQCGHVAQVVAREIEQVEGTLAEVSKIAAKRESWKEERGCKTLADWEELARKRGYKSGWARIRFQNAKQRSWAA